MTSEINEGAPTRLAAAESPVEVASSAGPNLVPSPAPGHANPPAQRVEHKAISKRPHWPRIAFALAILFGGSLGGFYWWKHNQTQLPPGVFTGNGRLDSDEIDIDTKFAGRIAEILADEGSMVKAGQVVARMDTRDIEASLKKAEAQVQQAQKAIEEANANVAQATAQALLAQQEMERTKYTVSRGAETKELLDQRQQQLDGANAALSVAKFRVIEAEHALEASTHDVEFYSVNIADNKLVAPRDGRIQYRVANVGEVLPAGGKVFTMLDISYVYMDVYLPTAEAGKVKFGADARIVLDAVPNVAIRAKVFFIATQAQFTPKTVETKDERDKLMFRIRVRIDPDRLRTRGEAVRSGLPGVTYIRTDPNVPWPPALQGSAV